MTVERSDHEAYLKQQQSLANGGCIEFTSVCQVCIEFTSVCIESTLVVYRNDLTCVSKRPRFASKRDLHRNDFVSKQP